MQNRIRPVGSCHELVGGIPFPLDRIQRREIPDQDVDPQLRLDREQPREKRAQLDRQSVVCAPGRPDQRRFRVNVPADDVYLPLGQQQRVPQRAKIRGSVVQDSYPARFTSLPDGPAGDEDR